MKLKKQANRKPVKIKPGKTREKPTKAIKPHRKPAKKKDYKGRTIDARHLKFVALYDGRNHAEAAEKSGFRPGYGIKLLKNPIIQQLIEDRLIHTDPDTQQAIADKEELQKYWTRLVRGKETRTVVTKNGVKVEVPVKTEHRLKGSELAGKSQGVFVDKHEHGLSPDMLRALLNSLPEDQAKALLALLTTKK